MANFIALPGIAICMTATALNESLARFRSFDCGEPSCATATETETQFQDVEWDEITQRLLVYALYRTSRYGSAAAMYRSRISDYVQESVMLYLEGRRHFVARAGFTLFDFLCGVIDSLVSHDVEKTIRKKEIAITAEVNEDDRTPGSIAEDRLASSDDFERRVIFFDDASWFLNQLEPELR